MSVNYACATESQATFLRNQVRELHAELLDSSSDMYESRLRDWKDIKGGENVTNDTTLPVVKAVAAHALSSTTPS